MAVKIGKITYIGARFELSEVVDYRPWPDGDAYIHTLSIKNVEFCNPYPANDLSEIGGKFWGIKYFQSSKPIKDKPAIEFIKTNFESNLTDNFIDIHTLIETHDEESEEDLENEIIETNEEATEILKEIPTQDISIMGTFQTIKFVNETDKIQGLETLVNNNFYALFANIKESNSILIPKNRLFKTNAPNTAKGISGIKSIPDAILISYLKNTKNPFRIDIIEYECFGEGKTRTTDKSNYMNSQIIPQLMRFASAFSIITDQHTRESTIKDWIEKIIQFTNESDELEKRFSNWIRDMNPNIKEKSIDLEIAKVLQTAFIKNIRILLIIDELNPEQKETIKNVINSFKLENGDSINFEGYVVKLVQRINIINEKSEFALTVQL